MNTRVLIVGGNEKVVSLINALNAAGGICIAGVCDTDKNSKGIKCARRLKLKATTDLAGLINDKDLDIVIEASGSKEFQKVLNQITRKDVKIIDAKAAEVLLSVACEKEKAKSRGQLYLVDKLSNIFSTGYDSHNIAHPIFNILKSAFNVSVEAMLIFYKPKDDLVITAGYELKDSAIDNIIDQINKASKKNITRAALNIYARKTAGVPKGAKADIKSCVAIPLMAGDTQEGIMFLASAKKGAFNPEDKIVLNILADELALFIENEKIKKDLSDAKGRLESMLYSMSEGVMAINKKSEVVLVNAAAKNLLGIEEIKLGSPFSEIIKDKNIVDLLRSAASSKSGYLTREIGVIKNDELRSLKCYAASVMGALGRPEGWILLFTDITKEKEVDRMKSEFISTTSHELRTPLAAIKESVMLMLDETAGKVTKQQGRFLEIAKRNINRLTDIINDLLDISKIESGRLKLKKAKVDISVLIEQALEPLDIIAKEIRLNLTTQIDKKLPKVKCDPDRITQVITNLVGNALKFTPADGMITVSAERCGKFIQVAVKDTGIGIEKKDMPRLFIKFGQLDGSLTRKPGGTGLGLAICKELIHMHKGKIWAESEPGKGSVFNFTLPV